VDCISTKIIFHACILAAFLCSFAAISMAMENQSQLHNVSLEQSLFEKQENQSQMIPIESQARNPMRGCTRSSSSGSSSGASAIICPCNFQDLFDQEISDLWLKSDWENVDPIYLNAWLPDPNHIRIADGNLQLTLDNEPCIDDVSLCHGQDYASGQYYTECNNFRYGKLSARIKAGKGNGVITSMYLFEDSGVAGKQDEIDIEIFGKNSVAPGKWQMQTNYLRKGNMGNCWVPYGVPEACHVGVIPLSFDPTESYHNYAISWIGEGEICTDIKWHVDDKLRRHVWMDGNGYIHSNIFDESGKIIESSNIYKGSLPNTGSRIILGLWAAQNWDLAGVFNYVSPITAKFDWMTFSQPNCSSDLNETVPVYRMYSPSQTDHFYTTSYHEYSTIAPAVGYIGEGILGDIYSSTQTGTIPVYRMYSPSQTDHFYTTNYYEYSTIAPAVGYIGEGILGNIYGSTQTGTIPVYRMYSPSQTDHFYTTSFYEYSTIAPTVGYIGEGILGYIQPVELLTKGDELPQVVVNATSMERGNGSAILLNEEI